MGKGKGLSEEEVDELIRMQFEPENASAELESYFRAYNEQGNPISESDLPFLEMRAMIANWI